MAPDPASWSREELLAALAERDAVIAALMAEVEQLKRRVGMDSSNFSMPPGSDGPAARAKRAKKTKNRSPRPRGGQPGHDGHALAWRSSPDQVTMVGPQSCCGCGQTLAGVEGEVVARVQVFDTPPVKLQVTEYRMVQVACPACRWTTRAATPPGLAGPCCYGPNVRAATALLACAGHMSITRAADLMGVLLDVPVSTGFTGGLVKRVADRLTGFESAVKNALRAAPVLHHDESPARVAADDGDRLLYVYTARADRLLWFGAADNRGHDALDGFGILPGYRGTLVRDDYVGYATYDQDLAAVQLCCAHLLRSLRGIGELDPDGSRVQRCWTEPVMSALTDAKAAVAQAHTEGATALDPQVLDALRARYDEAVAWGIATNTHRDWPSGRHPGYTLAKRLQTRAAQVWRFTVDFAVPFTNNPCEQPQRMVKLQMKIGGCWRSVRTAARYCLIRSYLGTARNHGIHPLDALRDALSEAPGCHPETPDQSQA
ncbi:IS66 family transposase [Nonomuraea sp. NEAU-A123]|uniref:IS66 family transposase n=1 Tax=Nonomuraea sp. NEAU-A123 TaxID=2839649 RepID=UPI001BE49597|nr:IS66 family transposase [Nonomuraea sp. NEAU-A123]MBT2231670.1 IS66 family transposase [Nonomuraea sp. NEAU-A123]